MNLTCNKACEAVLSLPQFRNKTEPEKKSIKIYVPKSVRISGDKVADEMMFGDILELIPEKIVGMSADEIIAKSHRAILEGPAFV